MPYPAQTPAQRWAEIANRDCCHKCGAHWQDALYTNPHVDPHHPEYEGICFYCKALWRHPKPQEPQTVREPSHASEPPARQPCAEA